MTNESFKKLNRKEKATRKAFKSTSQSFLENNKTYKSEEVVNNLVFL